MIIHCFDRESWTSALALPLDAELHALLVASLARLEGDSLLDLTDFLVVTAKTTDAELVDAIGWTPLVDADGRRSDDPAFRQPFDFAYQASATFHVAVQIVGNAGAAFEFAIHDDADSALLSLVRVMAE